jgi:ribosome biogenesis protein SSF1/2
MFPTINVKNVRLSECRRVVLFNFNKADGTVEMRHYAIRATPVGISRSVKKVLQSKIPDLGELNDISQFIEGQFGLGALSDSEAEDDNSRVTLPERFVGKGNGKSQQSAMKLSELGPRLTLEIFKVEQGVNEGDILYHKFIQKTRDEATKTKNKLDKIKQLKEQRKAVQEANVKRKREDAEASKAAYLEKKRLKMENGGAAAVEGEEDSDGEEPMEGEDEEGGEDSGDDDEGLDEGDDDEDGEEVLEGEDYSDEGDEAEDDNFEVDSEDEEE